MQDGRIRWVIAGASGDRMQEGRIRWVIAGASGDRMQDGRVGSKTAMAAVTRACAPIRSVTGLYDCSRSASALRAAA
jgi:hypothetical protein